MAALSDVWVSASVSSGRTVAGIRQDNEVDRVATVFLFIFLNSMFVTDQSDFNDMLLSCCPYCPLDSTSVCIDLDLGHVVGSAWDTACDENKNERF